MAEVALRRGRHAMRRRWMDGHLTTVMAFITYAATLHYAFAEKIAPAFGYAGFYYRTPAMDYYFYALLLALAIALVLPRRISRPSHLMLWVLYVTAVAPSILVPQYAVVLPSRPALVLALVVSTSFLIVVLGCRRPNWKFVSLVPMSPTSFWLLVALVSAVVYTVMFATVGIHFRLVALTEVYDVREEYKGQMLIAGGGQVLGYLLPLQANVINPLILTRGLFKRRWFLVAVSIVGQAAIYSSTGFKTVLFSTPFVMVAAWMFQRSPRPSGVAVLWCAALASIGALLMDQLTSSIAWTSLIVRRFLIIPGFLTAVYLVVFDLLPKAHLGDSLLAGFVRYPFDRSPALVVGNEFFGKPLESANANLFADGFMNFGYAGMIGEALVLLLVLRGIDSAARNVPTAVASMLVLMPTISLANSGVLTSITTHGLLGAAVLLAIMPRTGWAKDSGQSTPRSATRAASGAKNLRLSAAVRASRNE